MLSGLLSHLPWYGSFRAAEKEAAQCLEEVGMSALSQVPFGTLSGGQAQRVLIARALSVNRSCSLFDDHRNIVIAELKLKYTLFYQN